MRLLAMRQRLIHKLELLGWVALILIAFSLLSRG